MRYMSHSLPYALRRRSTHGAPLLSVIVIASLVCLSPNARAATTRYIECQHPVSTGVEVFALRHISAKSACPVALKLEATPNTYRCRDRKAVAIAHHFDGWALAINQSGFLLKRDAQSFQVTGEDNPPGVCFV